MKEDGLYHLLLKGGEVIDPASGLRGRYDVAFSGDRVAAIEVGVDRQSAMRSLDVSEMLVVPGLIDIHVHAGEGIGLGLPPDVPGVDRGATTVVDGGSFGAANFGAFRKLMSGSRSRVLAWLNISTIGQTDTSLGECLFLPWMDVDKAVASAKANQDIVVGFKGRLSKDAVGSNAVPALKLLLEAGEAAGLPVLIHVGDTGQPLGVILDMMRPGDVVSHYLTPRRHGILGAVPFEGARVISEAFAARERGVIFDVARGRFHASFPVMQAAVEQGLLPDTLSTDLTRLGAAADPSLSLPMIATQFMALGVTLEDLLPRMTIIPANVLGREDLGRLQVGGVGDATILRLEHGSFTIADVDGRTRTVGERLVAVGTARAGEYAPIA